MSYKPFLYIFLLVITGNIFCQAHKIDTISKVFSLGEVSIVSQQDKQEIDRSTAEKLGNTNAAEAISNLSGVSLASFGGRNETTVYVRGMDIRSVPVFIDGIPVYVPYDGYADLGKFILSDVSKISLSKGFTSNSYGANALGGAINIVTRKPEEKIEFEVKAGLGSGKLRHSRISIGSNLGKFYLVGSLGNYQSDYFPLSASFDTTGLTGSEDGGKRDNSYGKDLVGNFKIGFAPNGKDEYSISYQYQHGEKGTPPYSGIDPVQRERFWQWPTWDKQSLYFIAKKQIGSTSNLTARVFYDDFKNQLSSFDDNTYLTQFRGYAFNSYYNDYSIGTSVDFLIQVSETNRLKFSGYFKDDHHAEHNEDEAVRNFEDITFSGGLEDSWKIAHKLKLTNSLMLNQRMGLVADDYNSSENSISPLPVNGIFSTNIQSALHYKTSRFSMLKGFIAHKTRFPTMKERYSYRAGFGIPNPDLLHEKANHVEIAYSYYPEEGPNIKTALFYSYLKDAIINVYDINSGLSQFQNTGQANFYGFELEFKQAIFTNLMLSSNYTFLKINNMEDPDIKFINVPAHDAQANLSYQVTPYLDFTASYRYMSERYSTSYGTKASNIWLFNMYASCHLHKYSRLEFGIENILDRNYEMQEGFPGQGRTFSLSIVAGINR